MSQRLRKPKQVFTPEQTKSSKNSVSQHHDENNHGLNDASHDENLSTSIAHDEETPECQLYCICKQPYDGYSVMTVRGARNIITLHASTLMWK